MKERVRTAFRAMMEEGRRSTYALIQCQSLSECSRTVEAVLKSAGLRFTRLVDPDCYSLVSTAEYHATPGFSLLELRGELNRAFYVVSGPKLPSFADLNEEFRLYFEIKSPKGIGPLVRYICQGKIGKRHAHRSLINFVLSVIVGLSSPFLTQGASFIAQTILMIVLAVAMFLLLEYPVSFLYFKGVRIVSEGRTKVHLVVLKAKRDKNGT